MKRQFKHTSVGRIEEGALFVADSHYPHHGDEFLLLLENIDSGELVTPQLFLMGDNFDLLFGYNQYIQTFSTLAIELLQKISKKIEIYYFEGNHDFLLDTIFPSITVYPRELQPVIFTYKDRLIGLSHGDKYMTGLFYNIYSKIVRNRYVIMLLRPFEKFIINYRMEKLSQKNICHNFLDLSERVEAIVACYPKVDFIIEGHFHQSKVIGAYYSLPSLACHKKIGIFKDDKIKFIAISYKKHIK